MVWLTPTWRDTVTLEKIKYNILWVFEGTPKLDDLLTLENIDKGYISLENDEYRRFLKQSGKPIDWKFKIEAFDLREMHRITRDKLRYN